MATTNTNMPSRVGTLARTIAKDSNLNAGVKAMNTRADAFSSKEAALLAGIAAVPAARTAFESGLDEHWAADSAQNVGTGSAGVDEVIIGGGLHAAIYAAVRVSKGYAPPLVVEKDARVGGSFAVSRGPSFYLNSRNRPGPMTFPGEGGSLNALPGAILQPSDISACEFQRNDDLAWIIRLTLAMNAKVLAGRRVTKVERCQGGKRRYRVILDDEHTILTDRVIEATGLGRPVKFADVKGAPSILTFPELMSSLDQPFPLQGLRRVAVIGDGDSAKTAIEALTGQGPALHMSVPALDWIEQIDWYGPNTATSCEGWRATARTRYQGIGALLPLAGGADQRRVRVRQQRGYASPAFDGVYVNDRMYDAAVVCIGYKPYKIAFPGTTLRPEMARAARGDSDVDRLRRTPAIAMRRVDELELIEDDLFVVGPCAGLDFGTYESSDAMANLRENRTALFRLSARTAALAAKLPGKKLAKSKAKTKRRETRTERLARDPYSDPYGRSVARRRRTVGKYDYINSRKRYS